MAVNSGCDPVFACAHSTFPHRAVRHQRPAAGLHPALPGRRAPLCGRESREKEYWATGGQSRERRVEGDLGSPTGFSEAHKYTAGHWVTRHADDSVVSLGII
jgi:hypothetical protein